MPGYADGAWWVQDVAASIPARLIGRAPAEDATVLDLCAAPGGKTMQLAAAAGAPSRSIRRTVGSSALRENLHRTRLKATVVQADVLVWKPDEPADAVLIDAPCSATGIFRRHPDVLHRVRPAIVDGTGGAPGPASSRAPPTGSSRAARWSTRPARSSREGEAQLDRFLAARPDLRWFPLSRRCSPATDGGGAHAAGDAAGRQRRLLRGEARSRLTCRIGGRW